MNKRFDSELHQFPQAISDSEKDGLKREIRLAVKKLCSDSGADTGTERNLRL